MATVHLVDTRDRWAPRADLQDRGRTGFGEWLRRAREARGLTLDDITRETKIPLRNLVALEHGDFGVVPAFYERAEVRAIARAVGVDEGLAVGRLDSALAPVMAQPKPNVSRPDRKVSLSAVLGGLALVALLLVFTETGRAIFGWTSEPPRRQAELSRTTPSSATPPSETLLPATAAPATASATTSQPQPAARTQASDTEVTRAVTSPDVTAAEATAEVKAPPGSVTELVVRTEPPGAHVTVNGIGWGVSPVTIRHLSPGPKHIRATKEGFAATEQVLALGDGQRQGLDLRLRAAP